MKFLLSGVGQIQDGITGRILSGTPGYLIDPQLGLVVVSGFNYNPGTPLVSGYVDHTSRSDYLAVCANQEGINEARLFNFTPPCDELCDVKFHLIDLMQWSGASGVVNVYSGIGFDDGLIPSGVTFEHYGAGTVTYTGVVNVSGSMVGQCFAGLNASSNLQIMNLIDPAASGLRSGRIVYLTRIPASGSTSQSAETGFMFCTNANPTPSGKRGYEVMYKNSSSVTSGNTFEIRMSAEDASSTGNTFASAGTLRYTVPISFSSVATKNANRRRWNMVEWECFVPSGEYFSTVFSGVVVNVGYKMYEDGDTCLNVRDKFIPVVRFHDYQPGWPEVAVPSGFPCFGFAQRAAGSNWATAVDEIYLDKLETIPRTSFDEALRLVAYNTDWSYRLPCNIFPSTSGLSFEGNINYGTNNNPLVSSGLSPVGKTWQGMYWRIEDNDTGTETHSMVYEFWKPVASGMTKGVFRFGGAVGPTATSVNSGWIFGFLRQGPGYDGVGDTCYSLYCKTLSATNGTTLALRKGRVFTSIGTISTTLASPTSLATATVSGAAGAEINRVWTEVQWAVSGSAVNFDVYFKKVDNSFVTFDTSPGNVDYSWQKAFSYTDTVAPYTSTSYKPYLAAIVDHGSSFIGYSVELRKPRV